MTLTHLAAAAHCNGQCGRAVVGLFRAIWNTLPNNRDRAIFGGSVVVGAPTATWGGKRVLSRMERRGDRNRDAAYRLEPRRDNEPANRRISRGRENGHGG